MRPIRALEPTEKTAALASGLRTGLRGFSEFSRPWIPRNRTFRRGMICDVLNRAGGRDFDLTERF